MKQGVVLYICLKNIEQFVKGKVEILQRKILPTFTNFSTIDKLNFRGKIFNFALLPYGE